MGGGGAPRGDAAHADGPARGGGPARGAAEVFGAPSAPLGALGAPDDLLAAAGASRALEGPPCARTAVSSAGPVADEGAWGAAGAAVPGPPAPGTGAGGPPAPGTGAGGPPTPGTGAPGAPASVPAPPPGRAIGWMLLGSVMFAAMGTFVAFAHRADPTLSTFTASSFRSVVNLAVLLVLERHAPGRLLGDARPALWARGLLGGVALITFFAAIRSLSVGEAAFLNQTSAVWVALVSPWLLGQRAGGAAWVAVAGSLVGMALLVHPRADGSDMVGRILGLVSGVAAAGAYVSVNKASRTNPPVAIVFWFTLVGSVASITLALATGAGWPTAEAAAHLVGAGVAATGGQLLMTAAYRDGHAASVAAAGAASPLLTALLGWGLLHQVPDTRARLGMLVLVVCSTVLPFWSGRRK